MLDKPIPKAVIPNISEYNIVGVNEEIMSLSSEGFCCSSEYFTQGIAGAYMDCYARKSVIEKLKVAQNNLPKGLKFKIYDAYRPISVQQRLWNFYSVQTKNKNPKLSDEEIDFKISFFVDRPSYDIEKPSLHNTGGAIDLTIITDNGYELNMGTSFDNFTQRAWTNHFEVYEVYEEVKHNRRILYNAMINAGFTNLPTEWWHYDYGTKFWGYFTRNDALYKGILDINFPNRFPLF